MTMHLYTSDQVYQALKDVYKHNLKAIAESRDSLVGLTEEQKDGICNAIDMMQRTQLNFIADKLDLDKRITKGF